MSTTTLTQDVFYRRRARKDKARKLIEVIEQSDVPMTAERIADLSEHHWEALAEQAGVSLPSEATRSYVVSYFLLRFPGMNQTTGIECPAAGRQVDPVRLDGNAVGRCPEFATCRRHYVAHEQRDGSWVVGHHTLKEQPGRTEWA